MHRRSGAICNVMAKTTFGEVIHMSSHVISGHYKVQVKPAPWTSRRLTEGRMALNSRDPVALVTPAVLRQNTSQKQVKGEKAYFSSWFGGTVCHGRVILEAEARGSCSYCVHCQEAGSGACWYSAHLVLFTQARNPGMGWHHTPLGWVLSPPLT